MTQQHNERALKRRSGFRAYPGAALGIMLMCLSLNDGCAAAGTTPEPFQSTELRCLSMRALAREARANPAVEEVETLGGIGWIEGYVIDADNRDIILFGRSMPTWPTLHIDDLAVAVRNAWGNDVYPYCSLDPRPEDVRKLNALLAGSPKSTSMPAMFEQMRAVWGPQTVVVGGVSKGSRHAHVMIYADYHMKKVSQGLLHIDGIRSIPDISNQEARRQLEQTGRITGGSMSMSRFWFHVREGHPIFHESIDIVRIEDCDVVLLTEKQRANTDGILSDSGEDDPQAATFAAEFTANFRRATLQAAEYAHLENLYRLSAVIHAMRFRDAPRRAGLDLTFWLDDFQPGKDVPLPTALPGLCNSAPVNFEIDSSEGRYKYELFPMVCGGVSMETEVEEDNFTPGDKVQLAKIHQELLAARPAASSLTWSMKATS
ncbi:DUF1598 domain-containing protein [bacterium]|nr:DUF1598 domain-containing protein [candidate division CSSED10-310 bacterium]